VSAEIDEAKQEIRRRVWDLLVAERVALRGVHGYIPAFVGAEAAAGRLAGLPEWQAAQVVNAVPDRAQQPVRERALRDGKLLYVAVPRLAADLPFFVVDPASLTGAPAGASSSSGAARSAGSGPATPPSASPDPATPPHARKIGVADMRRVDMVVCGSVAVNRRGTRLGKGAGYSDIAVALLQEAGRIGPSTVIVTTVHPLQVIDEVMPETEHDFSVDLIVTPDEVIECEPPRRPSGLYWNNLTAAKIAAIPVLAARAAAARRQPG
jgi:5-formyltetrahydrofolate cyclo-ligase